MKTLMLLSLMLLLLPAFGQEPAVVEPIKIAIIAQGETPQSEELDKLFRHELNKRRDMVIVSSGPDYDLYVTTTTLAEDGRCAGHIVVTLAVNRSTGHHQLTIHTGEHLPDIVEMAVKQIGREFFSTAAALKYKQDGGKKPRP